MGQITKRSYKLSDGRDIIYFDDADTVLPPDRGEDLRAPAVRPPTATMRQDVLTGEWISIAAARQNRVVLPPSHLDPLAPASPENPSEIPSLYDVAVFENKSPSFGPELAGAAAPEGLDDLARVGLGRSRQSVGRCEVVCFSPEHTGSLAGLPLSRMRTVVEAWADRTAALSALPGVEQVFPFENRGEAIGVTLHHPHGQIYAYPYITPRTAQLVRTIESYGGSLFEDILSFEQKSERVLLQGEHWTAFVPFAARWPLEVHILPHRHVPDLAATTDEERDEFSRAVRPAPARRRCPLRHPHSVHFGVAPGSRPRPPGRHPAHAAADLAPPGGGQAQVPGRVGGRDGRIHRGHPAGNGRRPAPRGHGKSRARATACAGPEPFRTELPATEQEAAQP